MSEYVGPLQRIAISHTLWLILVLPLLAAAAHAVMARRRTGPRTGWRVAIAAMAAALAIAVGHAVGLAGLPPSERFLLEHLWRMVRVGQLDVNLDLAFDPLSAVACVVVLGAGLVAAVASREMAPGRHALRELAVAATLLVVLADGLAVAIAAAELATLASWWLAADARRGRVLVGTLLADGAFVAGAALLFWGLGGGWVGGGYTPDLGPRFVAAYEAVAAPTAGEREAPRARAPRDDDDDDDRRPIVAPGDGLLTLTSAPGAIVFLDDARTPLLVGEGPLRSPFVRHPIRGGLHSFRIHAGLGADDYVVPRVLVDGGREVALTVLGPSMTYRQIRDQLVIRPERGGLTMREAFGRRTLASVRVVTLAGVLLFIGILARAARMVEATFGGDGCDERATDALLTSLAASTVAVTLLARLAFLFSSSHEACAVTVCGGATIALLAAVSAWRDPDPRRVLVRVGLAEGAFALAAIGLGAYAAGVVLLVVASLGLAALHLSPSHPRANVLACMALAGSPAPFVGAFWPVSDMVVSAFASRVIAPVPTSVAYVALVMAIAAISFALWRRHYSLLGSGRPHAPGDDSPRLALALAVTALAAGPVLGASRRVFGDQVDTLLETWLDPVFAAVRVRSVATSSGTSMALVLVAFGGSMAAWAVARRRGAVPASAAATPRAGVDSFVVRVVRRFAAFVTSLDRWVIDGAVGAALGGVRLFAWMGARVDEEIVDAPARGGASRALRGVPRLRRLAEMQTWIYALLLGAFAAVVLYSVFAAA